MNSFALKCNQLKSRGAGTGRELLNNHDNGVEDNLTNVQGLVAGWLELKISLVFVDKIGHSNRHFYCVYTE